MTLFVPGPFRAHSGAWLPFKINCDALNVDDWATIAEHVVRIVGPFCDVVGVRMGGVPFEQALLPYATPDGTLPRLIVDDVLTSGGSMNETRRKMMKAHRIPETKITGVVLFARGPCPSWVRAVFTLNEEFR